MKSRPILFNAPMVRALLDGSKTQTRRVASKNDAALLEFLAEETYQLGQKNEDGGTRVWCDDYPEEGSDLLKNRYGQVGDQLWVKETHWRDEEDGQILYAADPIDREIVDQNKYKTGLSHFNWKPSIFMRREYSRLTLEITNVRVERLQDITRGDCMAEGCPFPNIAKERDPKGWYSTLWTSINGEDSWDANPWVWVIEFKKVTTESAAA